MIRKRFLAAILSVMICTHALHADVKDLRVSAIPHYARVSGEVYTVEGNAILSLPDVKVTVDLHISDTNFTRITTVSTDNQGSYSIDSLNGKAWTQYRFTYSLEGYRNEQVLATIRVDTNISIRMIPNSQDYFNLTGTVTYRCPDCDGKDPLPYQLPVSGCTVTVRLLRSIHGPGSADPGWGPFFTSYTDENGVYGINKMVLNVLPGEDGAGLSDTLRITVRKAGFLTQEKNAVLRAGGIDTLNFDLAPELAGTAGILRPLQPPVSLTYTSATGVLNFGIEKAGNFSMDLFSADGRLIGTLFKSQFMPAGRYGIPLHSNLPHYSGIVLVRAKGEGIERTLVIKRF